MRTAAAVLASLGAAVPAVAHEEPGHKWPAEKKGKEPLASRSGKALFPYYRQPGGQRIAKWAIPGVTKHECGYYVGGSAIYKGTTGYTPGPTEGTFGWDYVGRFPGRVALKFYGEKPKQMKFFPKYEQDGRRLPGDPIAEAPFRKAVIEAREEHGGPLVFRKHYHPAEGHAEGGHEGGGGGH